MVLAIEYKHMKYENLAQKTKALLEEYGVYPNKRLGQNFLINKDHIHALIEAAEIDKSDNILEVGPGTGNVTEELAKHAKSITAVEKDPKMVDILQERFKDRGNIEVVHEDILSFMLHTSNFKAVGAPPYYLTARLFRHFLENTENPPNLIAVVIQKEVAEKIIAKPPKMNLLAASVQLYGNASIVKKIPRSSFWPQPDVDSALLVVKNVKKPLFNEKDFFKLVRAGFSSPRKQLAVNLSNILKINRGEVESWLEKSDIDPKRRAETLSIEEWKRLVDSG